VAIAFDDDISSTGTAVLGFPGTRVLYALWSVTTVGPESRLASLRDSDRYLRLGFITFGHRGSEIGEAELDFWDPPIWLDFLNGRYHPDPQADPAANLFSNYAEILRWSLDSGTLAHLVVAVA